MTILLIMLGVLIVLIGLIKWLSKPIKVTSYATLEDMEKGINGREITIHPNGKVSITPKEDDN